MIYCFDTSAINKLCDDPERQAIVRGVRAAHSVYVTAVNCVEVLATTNPTRLSQLHNLLNELAGGQYPLAFPTDVLKMLTICYAEGRNRPNKRGFHYQFSVDDYFVLDGEKKDEILKFKTRWEESFDAYIKVRPSFEKLFTSGTTERPSSLAALIRDHFREEAFLYSMMQDLYRVTGQTLPSGKLYHFLERVPEWSVLLLSLAYATYTRSIQREGYGHRGKAGAVDLWSSVYLQHCDYFVTHDYDQFKAFRFGKCLNPRMTCLLRYSEFRVGLLIG